MKLDEAQPAFSPNSVKPLRRLNCSALLRRGRAWAFDQWARFRPGGDVNGRWTDAAVVYLVDMFPMALDGFDHMSAEAVAREKGGQV